MSSPVRRALLAIGLVALVALAATGCGDDSPSQNNNSSKDLSAMADLSGSAACAGAGLGTAVACDPGDTDVCFPDNLTYCFCRQGQWSCCGDNLPTCPDAPGAVGAFCCPGAPAGPGSTELDCPYACTAGHRTVCSCADDFVWRCNSEVCSDAGP